MNAIARCDPCRRPVDSVVMRPGWHHLLFLHWAIDATAMQALLPTGLEVDTFGGDAWAGLVPFTMTQARPCWAPTLSSAL